MAAIPRRAELLSSGNMLPPLVTFSQLKEKKICNPEENSQHLLGSITRCSFVTGVRFAPAAPQLPPLVVITAKSIFDDKDHI